MTRLPLPSRVLCHLGTSLEGFDEKRWDSRERDEPHDLRAVRAPDELPFRAALPAQETKEHGKLEPVAELTLVIASENAKLQPDVTSVKNEYMTGQRLRVVASSVGGSFMLGVHLSVHIRNATVRCLHRRSVGCAP